MFFFDKKPSVVLCLRKNSLDLVNLKNSTTIRLPLDSNIVSNIEVKDLNAYEKKLAEFFDKYIEKGQQPILILSDEILFKKQIKITAGQNLESLEQTFYDEIPFNPENLYKGEFYGQDQLILFTSNKQLFQPILDIYQKVVSVKPKLIFPAFIFGDLKGNFTTEQAQNIILNFKKLQKNLDKKPEPSTNFFYTRLARYKIYIVLIIIALFILVALIFLAILKSSNPNQQLNSYKLIPKKGKTSTESVELATPASNLKEATDSVDLR